MHQIILYEDRNGSCPVDEYLQELDTQNTKDARIRGEKIRTYVKILKERGLPLPEPLCKHMVDKIYVQSVIGYSSPDGLTVHMSCFTVIRNRARKRLRGS